MNVSEAIEMIQQTNCMPVKVQNEIIKALRELNCTQKAANDSWRRLIDVNRKLEAALKQAKGTLTFLSGLIQQGSQLHLGETVAYESQIGTAVVDTMLEVIREIEKLGV